MISYEFDLEVTPGSMPPILHMAQYDSGRIYTANLKNNGVAFSPVQGSTAKIKGRNAAGVCWEQDAEITGSTVTFTPEGAATDQFGIMPVQLEIAKTDTISTLLIIFDIQRAGYTNEEAVRSPEFQTALEAAVAAAIEEGGIGFSDEFKQALLACFAHVAWTDEHGQDYYDALEAALYPEPEPASLVSITADYEQDRGVYITDSLDKIKLDLTVTANYSDGTSAAVTDYTLSGTLTAGTSTVTVSFGGKTASISVTVTDVLTGYNTIGTPAISNNILTPGSSGMIYSPAVFSPGRYKWKLRVGFTTGSTINTFQDVLGSVSSDGSSQRGFMIENAWYSAQSRAFLGTYYSSNGTTWNISSGEVGQYIEANKSYLFEVEFTGSIYRARISEDNGQTWTEWDTYSSSTAIKDGYYIGVGLNRNGYFAGTIDLTSVMVWINDIPWWKAVL